jgi:hypothetical protein
LGIHTSTIRHQSIETVWRQEGEDDGTSLGR